MRLTDREAEQIVIEEILEESKPPLPADTAGLDYLLFTPFRYPPFDRGSRFRAVTDPGVLYGANETRTACAELGYWRWRFVMDSEALRKTGIGPMPHTLFQAAIDTRGVDLTQNPFVRDRGKWTARDDYTATQTFARVARKAEIGAILYESVRDPEKGLCIAVLRADAFSPKSRLAEQSWMLKVSSEEVVWGRGGDRFVFHFR